jgi:hypothetical protein
MKGHLKKSKVKHKKHKVIHKFSHTKKNKRRKNLVHPFHALKVPIPVWKK